MTHLLSMYIFLSDENTSSYNRAEVVSSRRRLLVDIAIHENVIQSFGVDSV